VRELSVQFHAAVGGSRKALGSEDFLEIVGEVGVPGQVGTRSASSCFQGVLALI